MSKKRILYIDIARGLGMLSVIWGHIMHSGWSYNLVYSFDIPLFFLLSGMVFRKEKYNTLKDFLKHRAKTILLPYVIFSVITWIIWVAYNYVMHENVDSYINPLLQTFISQGSSGYLQHNFPLWFVGCLMVVQIGYFYLSKAKDSVNILICIVLAIIGRLMLIPNGFFDFTKLPWSIEAAMSAMLFYAVGNLFVKHFKLSYLQDFVQKNKGVSVITVIAFTALLVVLGNLNGDVSLGSNRLGNSTLLYYVVGFIGIVSSLFFATLLGIINTPPKKNKVVGGVSFIGMNSLYFMFVHEPITRVSTIVLSRIVHIPVDVIRNTIGYSFIAFIITIISSALCVIVINIIRKKVSQRVQIEEATINN